MHVSRAARRTVEAARPRQSDERYLRRHPHGIEGDLAVMGKN
jgi:hypothetical protein